MGNRFTCMTKKETKDVGSRSKRMGRSQRKLVAEEDLHLQALSMALQQHQLSQRFEGSMSRRIGSTSSRRRNLSDSFSVNKQVQVPEILENIKIKKFVLIHGEGFGAWCWYKTVALLEESGLLPIALDLTGSGIDLTDANSVTTLAEYSKPLTDYLVNLPDDEKVILIGHSIGGACISYALEHYSEKISKAIFLCATMVTDGQRPFDVFADELGSAEHFMKESKFLIHGNGKEKPPTGFMFEKEQMKGLYFNQSPSKDVALAMVSMRPSPLGPIMEKLSLSPNKYGRGRRFYIQTLDDRALSPDVQEKLVRENPPEGVFKIKGSDHCPFFSKPQSLHKILVEIAQIP
ncbi:putative methylesterase 12, chloroplastic isoform X1 [Arachis ipaensis]|uniref:Methylesterase 12 n=1 Tax=Arachis hypogaea TaxID=3818 RepID=A0A6B9V4J3_ARAHY|nr:putative methylesterase 12, chloroplastic isoform X1 [Arachis ipaensis]XP_025657305.1 putative methylesterase 12, chloroplastic isoform X1 [Arachis hypogaea]QHN75378.1 Putative methylesterase 12 [Arachis hypogaea]